MNIRPCPRRGRNHPFIIPSSDGVLEQVLRHRHRLLVHLEQLRRLLRALRTVFPPPSGRHSDFVKHRHGDAVVLGHEIEDVAAAEDVFVQVQVRLRVPVGVAVKVVEEDGVVGPGGLPRVRAVDQHNGGAGLDVVPGEVGHGHVARDAR